MSDIKLSIGKDLLEGMEILDTMFSPVNLDMGILLLGEKTRIRNTSKILRFYRLQRNKEEYEVEKELTSFSFPTTKDADNFILNLKKMSALDLMVLL